MPDASDRTPSAKTAAPDAEVTVNLVDPDRLPLSPAEQALLRRAADRAITQERLGLMLEDRNRVLQNGAVPADQRRAIVRDLADMAPPGWQDQPPTLAGRSLSALSPTPCRVLGAVLVVLALMTGLALLA